MAGALNFSDYVSGTTNTKWQTAYMTELIWSGVIETLAITAVFITDSDLLRAIGAWSMVGVNATSLYLIDQAQAAQSSTDYATVMILHGVALGMSIVTWGQTFFVDSGGNFKYGGAADECKMMKEHMRAMKGMDWKDGKDGMMGDKPDGERPPPSDATASL